MSKSSIMSDYDGRQGYGASDSSRPHTGSISGGDATAPPSSRFPPDTDTHAIDLRHTYGASKGADDPPSYSASVLPPGWEAKRDDWGRLYYVDHNRGVTQWEAPVDVDPHHFGTTPTLFQRFSSAFASASAPSYDAAGAPGVNSVAYGSYDYTIYPNPRGGNVAHPVGASYGSSASIDTYALSQDSTPSQTSPLSAPIIASVVDTRRVLLPNSAAAFDWSVLTQGQLEDVAPADFSINDTIKDFHVGNSLLDTISRNTCLCIFSVVLWCFITAAVVLNYGNSRDGSMVNRTMVLFIAAGMYFMWTVLITAHTGFFFGCIPGCTCVTSGKGVTDKPLEALRAPVAKDTTGVQEYYAKLRSGRPIITLHVECSHYASHHSDTSKSRRVVTYYGQRELAVERWKDISVDMHEIDQAIHERASGNICVSYSNSYRLHPSQVPLIEALRVQFKEENAHRDHWTSAWVTYTVEGHDENHVDVIAQEDSCYYYIYRILCNWFTFYLSVWSTTYIFYISMWKCVQKPVRLTSIKYIHLAEHVLPVEDIPRRDIRFPVSV